MLLHVFRQSEPTRKPECLRVALGRDAIDVWAAGIRQPKQPRDFVEGLAGCVINRFAEHLDVTGQIAHVQQRRVPTRDEQRDGRILERTFDAENICAHVPN